MAGMATKSSDDLAFEAMELIRKKNVHFRVQTKGQTWDCTLIPRDEHEKASGIDSSSTQSKGSPTSSLKSGRSSH